MEASELHDLSDDADYAASQLQVCSSLTPPLPLTFYFAILCKSILIAIAIAIGFLLYKPNRYESLREFVFLGLIMFLSLQGSASMMRCESDKRSRSSDPDAAELIYLKDNVAIHPTQFASERISGRLKLTKQDALLFLVIFLIASSTVLYSVAYSLILCMASRGFRTRDKPLMQSYQRKVYSYFGNFGTKLVLKNCLELG